MYEDLINMVLKIFLINICTYCVCLKSIEYKKNKTIQIIIASMISTLIYVLTKTQINDNTFVATILSFIFQILCLMYILRDDSGSLIVLNFISNAIVYIALGMAMLMEYAIKILLNIDYSLINVILILTLTALLITGFFKIGRFKHGFSFLKQQENNDYLDMIMINISAMVLFAFCIFASKDKDIVKNLFFAFIFLSVIMIIMIQKTLTLYYKQKLLSKTIEDYKSEIASKDEQIKKLSDEKFKISKLNHEFYNRQKALEKKVQDFVSNSNAEASSELSVMESINNLSKGYTEELEKIKSLDKLTSTDIEEIDDMFKYMQSECKNNNIDFKLQINGNIHHMVNKIIPQDRLVTLIGDHLRDAIIAINVGDNKFRSILAILGIKDECYELCIYDSGVEFTIDTLSKLGIEQITTHKDSGGSGMGFITTFETMKQTGASLIIDEKCKPSANDYTKAVIIRFDGKNEYRIFSYRSKEIKNKIKNNRAIIKDRM